MGKFFLWLLILFVLGYSIYFGINWIKIRLDYSSMESEAERLFSPTSDCPYHQVPKRLIQKAEEQNIPLKEENIEVYVDEWNGYRVLNFEYVDSIAIFNFKNIYFNFSFVDTVFSHRQ
jgi:hypothetical protein